MNQELIYQKDNRSVNHPNAHLVVSMLPFGGNITIWSYDEIRYVFDDPITSVLFFGIIMSNEPNVEVKMYL